MSDNTHPLVKAMIDERTKAGLKLTVHYPEGDWTGYAKSPKQLAGWIADANRCGLAWSNDAP